MRKTVLLLAAMGATLLVAGGAALAASINCPNASGGYCYGTSAGDGMYGTSNVDRMYGQGGADLMYGYGGADYLYGGNETGWGDKILGGSGNDRIYGEYGDDALYGDSGSDQVYGGYGDDLVQGGYGYDTLSGGPGADQINAREGEKDIINVCGSESGDIVYYDANLDVFQGCTYSAQGTADTNTTTTTLSADEASSEVKEVKLVAEKPPKGVFEHTGKVLVENKGKEKCVSEKAVKAETKAGATIVNPTECSNSEEGRR